MSFGKWLTDAAGSISENVLPFFDSYQKAEVQKSQIKADKQIQQNTATVLVASEMSKQKIYIAMAVSAVASVALIVLLRARRS